VKSRLVILQANRAFRPGQSTSCTERNSASLQDVTKPLPGVYGEPRACAIPKTHEISLTRAVEPYRITIWRDSTASTYAKCGAKNGWRSWLKGASPATEDSQRGGYPQQLSIVV